MVSMACRLRFCLLPFGFFVFSGDCVGGGFSGGYVFRCVVGRFRRLDV